MNEKVVKYQDLGREISPLWNTKVIVVPDVVGARGMGQTLLGTARILRRTLEAYGCSSQPALK